MSKLKNMDTFTESYITTALWSSTDGEEPLDKEHTIDNIEDETIDKMIADCKKFQNYSEEYEEHDDSQVGHDFWLTRNHHGAGFWDGDYEEPLATKLTDLSHEFGDFDLYIDDDGLIYGMG